MAWHAIYQEKCSPLLSITNWHNLSSIRLSYPQLRIAPIHRDSMFNNLPMSLSRAIGWPVESY
ncbi:10310_t:CDS:2 [Gigaspora margarita]|uniref:10310_t:CDS:1 n=1 Tax=Gigaspora margarita TaxID=4874 RepID=A0ABN7VWK8_GIGMA|nr:10310_t:CDS:2 [Gigaspora margarita]